MLWDVGGYYSYLPGIFIYGDLTELDWLTRPDDGPARQMAMNAIYYIHPNGNKVIKYPTGTAIAYFPFFAVAHTWASNSSKFVADGYDKPYQLLIALSSVFYAFIGLFVLRKVLLSYFSDNAVALSLLCICLGTNLLYYTSVQSGMSHIHLFFLYSVVLYTSMRWWQSLRKRYYFIMVIALSWACLSRPTDIVLIFIPLLYGVNSISGLRERALFLFRKYQLLIGGLLLSILIGSIQMFYWKYATGQWLYDSYIGERFNFSSPHIIDGLFSYRKGWLIYSPVMVFSLIGLFYIKRFAEEWLWPVVVAFGITVYIVFSWEMWWYGGGFGARVLIQSYALLAIPFTAFVYHILDLKASRVKKLTRVFALVVLLCLTGFGLLTHFQYQRHVIHWDSMNKEYF